jgi:hypothetical protein
MTTVEIPANLVANVGAAVKMDFHLVDVKLRDGRVLRRLVVRGGRFIAGRERDRGEKSALPFRSEDVANVRCCAPLLGGLWPFWPRKR